MIAAPSIAPNTFQYRQLNAYGSLHLEQRTDLIVNFSVVEIAPAAINDIVGKFLIIDKVSSSVLEHNIEAQICATSNRATCSPIH